MSAPPHPWSPLGEQKDNALFPVLMGRALTPADVSKLGTATFHRPTFLWPHCRSERSFP